MKEFLSREGHAFIDKNVEEDPGAYEELLALGWRAVPVTIIGERTIKGFDEAELRGALVGASISSPDR